MSNEKKRIISTISGLHKGKPRVNPQIRPWCFFVQNMDEVSNKWKMVALLHEEEENREQSVSVGGGKCWEKEKETGKATFAGASQVK